MADLLRNASILRLRKAFALVETLVSTAFACFCNSKRCSSHQLTTRKRSATGAGIDRAILPGGVTEGVMHFLKQNAYTVNVMEMGGKRFSESGFC